MGNKLKLKGLKFCRLLVLEESCTKLRDAVTWRCLCDCDSETLATSTDLTRKNKKSCGCFQSENARKVGIANRKEPGTRGFNHLYKQYKNRASEKGLQFLMDSSLFRALTSAPCYYCGKAPSQVTPLSGGTQEAIRHAEYKYNGLDRVDSSRGYVCGNVVPCCGGCNYAKRLMNLDDFKSWVKQVNFTLFGECV